MHRNLTAENILIESDGYIKIIDFSYAKMLEDDQLAVDN